MVGLGVFFPGTGSSFLLQLDTKDKASGQVTFSHWTVGLSTKCQLPAKLEPGEVRTGTAEPVEAPVTSAF